MLLEQAAALALATGRGRRGAGAGALRSPTVAPGSLALRSGCGDASLRSHARTSAGDEGGLGMRAGAVRSPPGSAVSQVCQWSHFRSWEGIRAPRRWR